MPIDGEIEPRIVRWTVEHSVSVGCGHHDCENCGAVTPRPTDEEIIAFVRQNPGQNFMWPSFDDWTPKGWNYFNGRLLCPACIAVSDAALKLRAKAGQ